MGAVAARGASSGQSSALKWCGSCGRPGTSIFRLAELRHVPGRRRHADDDRESQPLRNARRARAAARRSGQHSWVHGLPLKMRFHRSKLYISVIPPFMHRRLRRLYGGDHGRRGRLCHGAGDDLPAARADDVVIGTSLFQIVFVTALTTLLHAMQNKRSTCSSRLCLWSAA